MKVKCSQGNVSFIMSETFVTLRQKRILQGRKEVTGRDGALFVTLLSMGFELSSNGNVINVRIPRK